MERSEGQRERRGGERGGVEGRGKKGRKSSERRGGAEGMREGMVAEGRCGR